MTAKYISVSDNPIIGIDKKRKLTYVERTFLHIISWYVLEKTEAIGQDLIINTKVKYDKIILNGKIINK